MTTEFCALCADDDLVVLDGVQRCLDALRANPQASVAQGYSFSFLCQHNGDMDLGNILYFTSTIDDATPLARLAKLFARYQAATYGNYRTPVLQRIFDTLKPMRSILARELLGTALAAIEGQMIRVACFSHGRSMDASESYEHWHPLEWFAKEPQGLFSEYHFYRELMARGRAASGPTIPSTRRRSGAFSTSSTCATWSVTRRMARLPSLQIKKCPACPSRNIGRGRKSISLSTRPRSWNLCSRNGRVLSRRWPLWRRAPYNLHPNFSAPLGMAAPAQEAIKDFLHALDNYQPHLASAKTARAHLPARTTRFHSPHRPINRSITVSVLLCNYNDARYLPDSLSAICTQTRLPEEVVVIDDGSTDNSVEIIEDFGRRYPFIRILRNEANRGLLYSINRALNEARCDFVVWAAADDRLLPNFLERNAQCLSEHPAAGMTFSRLAVFTDGSDEITSFTERNYGTAFDFGTTPRFLSPQIAARPLAAKPPMDFRQYRDGKPQRSRSRSAGLTRSCAGTPTISDSWRLRCAWRRLHPGNLGPDAPAPPDLFLRRHGPTHGAARHIGPTGGQADHQGLAGHRHRCSALSFTSLPLWRPDAGRVVAQAAAMAFCGRHTGCGGQTTSGASGPASSPGIGSRCARMTLRAVLATLTDPADRPRGLAHMMRDFTLVIPTYNRAQSAGRTLELSGDGKSRLPCPGARTPAVRRRLRPIAYGWPSSLDVEFAEFADLEPAEKWRQGIHKVTTPFCALCADDDSSSSTGVQRCLDALRSNLVGFGGAGLFLHLPAASRRRHGIEQYRIFQTDHR